MRIFRDFESLSGALCVLIFVFLVCLVGYIGARADEPVPPRKWHEADYAEAWAAAHAGVCEVRNADATRTDIVTETHAIEVDYAHKWAEAVGQCLHYAIMTELQPGVVLILDDDKDQRYVERIKRISRRYHLCITVWTMRKRQPVSVHVEEHE